MCRTVLKKTIGMLMTLVGVPRGSALESKYRDGGGRILGEDVNEMLSFSELEHFGKVAIETYEIK